MLRAFPISLGWFGRLKTWAFAAALALAAAPATTETLPLPPLKPGEVIAVTRNGCALIESPKTPEARIKFREYASRRAWKGQCRNGLAHGAGEMIYHPPDGGRTIGYNAYFFLGRQPLVQRSSLAGHMVYRSEDGRFAFATSDASLDNPIWPDAGLGWSSSVGVGGVNFTADTEFEGSTRVFGVEKWVPEKPGLTVFTPCPNRFTRVGCEGLWRQIAGPKINEFRAFRAQVQAREPIWRAELQQLNAARDARFEALGAEQAFARSQAAAQSQAGAGACYPLQEEARIGAELRTAMARIPSGDAVSRYEAILAAMERSAAAWTRCPYDPNSAAKLTTYRTAYVDVANRCAMISPTGACTPRMP